MSKKIVWPIAALVFVSVVIVVMFTSSLGNTGKEYVVSDEGGYFEYEDVTLEIDKDFTDGAFSLTLSSFEPKETFSSLGFEGGSAYEFTFEDLDEIKDIFRIFMPKTSDLETPLGFLGVYELDGFRYYPVIGKVGEDKFFVFDIPAAAIRNSQKPIKTAHNLFIKKAHALDSIRGYIFRWALPHSISATTTDNFRIFYLNGMSETPINIAADELESKYTLYSKMGYNLHKQKSMDKLNVCISPTLGKQIDGKLIGKKFGDYELYKLILLDGGKGEKKIRDTATHELFHVAQLPYKLPLWLEEATATYMEKYSSTYKDYPVESKAYYDLLFFQGFKTSTAKVTEDHFGYALSTYIKYIIDKLKPKNDGVFLREVFEMIADRDTKNYVFNDIIGLKKNWILPYYTSFINEEIYPYGGIADILNNFKKTEQDYSLNPESLVGKELSFSNLAPYSPAMMRLIFTDPESITGETVSFYYEDLQEQTSVGLIMVVIEYDSKNKAHKVVLVKKREGTGLVALPKKYLTERFYKVYLVAVNKTDSPIKSYRFALKNTLFGSSMFEDIEFMGATVTYSVSASEDAQKAYQASHAKGKLTAQQRQAKWDSVTIYNHITSALDYNGKTFHGKCRVSFDKEKSIVKFYFDNRLYRSRNEESYNTGYLTDRGMAIFASSHKENLIINEVKTKKHKLYGKGSASQSEAGNVTANLNITQEIYGRTPDDKQGSITMIINLVGP